MKTNNSRDSYDSYNDINKYKKILPKQLRDKQDVRISKINIDSRHRTIESKNVLGTNILYLEANPIDIIMKTINDSEIVIRHVNHSFQINDSIILQGAMSKVLNLAEAITFISNNSYARINHKNHGINFDTINDMYIEIENFIGDRNNDTDYNNIPINQINGLQKIYATKDSIEIKNDDYYYIQLGSIISNFSATYNLTDIKIIFNDINGVNLNLINANYPLSIDQFQGYHTITDTTDDTIIIALKIVNNISVYGKGGNNIWIAKVNSLTSGYPVNNFYKIPLKKTFYNISKIKLISTEFPNTEKVIKSMPEKKKNNMFYWKLQSDGNAVYSVELDSGNYSVDLLASSLKSKIEAVKRETLRIINLNVTDYTYYEFNECTVSIEPRTDVFSIKFYSTIFHPRALTFKTGSSFIDTVGRLIVTHPNHRLIAGVTITILNATYTDSIPQEVINTSFEVEKVIDDNTYQIKLPKYNISATNTDVTNGGEAMGIKFPIKSQILFDRTDTIGNLIGYRNSGKPNAISNYQYTNINTDAYQNDMPLANIYNNNSINMSGDNYILMSCPIFKDSYNSGQIDNLFAKLLLSDEPGSVLFNQFIQIGENFNPPLAELSEWEVSFYDAEDELYNFGNLNHSYTLEIHEII